jgi:hypothetical protein
MSRRLLAAFVALVAIVAVGVAVRGTRVTRSEAPAAPLGLRPLRVIDGDGRAIPGASVLRWESGSLSTFAETGPDGIAVPPLPSVEQPAALLAVANGFVPRTVGAVWGTKDPLEVRLVTGCSLTLQISSAEGEPARGAVVAISVPGVELMDPALRPAHRPRSRQLKFDAATKRKYQVEDGVGLHHWFANSDERGVARLSNLPLDVELFATIEGPDGVRAERRLRLEGDTDLAWSLPARVSFHGRLLDREGRPVSDHVVWCEPARDEVMARYFLLGERPQHGARTDREGRFELSDVPAGIYHIGPGATKRDGGSEIPPIGLTVHVTSELAATMLDLTIDRGLFIHGVVVSESSAPMPDAHVTLAGIDVRGTIACEVAPDGSFRAGPLAAGQYEARATVEDCPCSALPVLARGGDFGVVLVVLPAVKLLAFAHDQDGKGVELTEMLVDSAASGLIAAQALRGNHGHLLLKEAPAGELAVTVRTIDGRIGLRTGVQGSNSSSEVLRIEVGPPATLRVTNRSSSEAVEALVRTSRRAIVGVVRLGPGETRSVDVPAGTLLVEGERVGSPTESITIEAAIGETSAVALGLGN